MMKLELSDADSEIPSSIAFYITSGNPLAHFSVRNTGEVYVSKSIDRERIDVYHLGITATDGKFVSSTKLTIKVLDVNGKFEQKSGNRRINMSVIFSKNHQRYT